MEYQIQIGKPWTYRHPKRGRQLLPPGLYRVPEDVLETVAGRAISDGVAERQDPPRAPVVIETKAAAVAPTVPRPACETVQKCWDGLCIVAAPGPSLTPEIAEKCRDNPVLAVNDAYRLFPFAEALYACDAAWWKHHEGCKDFAGQRWSSHGDGVHNDKRPAAEEFGLRLVRGADQDGFSFDPALIHYADNSGFQAVNLAIHKLGGRGRIVLVGFDMRMVKGQRHFFGEHPKTLRATGNGYKVWPGKFARAARHLPDGLEIVNCTPGSALTCFRTMELSEALRSSDV